MKLKRKYLFRILQKIHILCILGALAALAQATEKKNILVLVPMNGKSHMNYMEVFIRELINRGHEVTCITSVSISGTKPDSYTEVLIDPPFDINAFGKYKNLSNIHRGNTWKDILFETIWNFGKIKKKKKIFAVRKTRIYESTWMPTIFTLTILPYFGYLSAGHAFADENVQNFMRRKDLHFDLVIHEEVLGHESFLIFGHRFKAPVVSICEYFF